MLLRLLWLASGLAVSLAPAWAAGEPHYTVQLSLQPAMRELHVRMRVSLPAGAERRFGLDRGFAVKTMAIDGQTVDTAGQTWPLPTGRPVEIVYTAALPALDAVQAVENSRRLLIPRAPMCHWSAQIRGSQPMPSHTT